VFDAVQAVALHGESRTTSSFKIDKKQLIRLYKRMKEINVIAKTVVRFASTFKAIMAGEIGTDIDEVVATINESMTYFEVAYITNNEVTADREIQLCIKVPAMIGVPRRQHTQTIPVTSDLLEPIGYPILFPEGSKGWGEGK
jgi:hypothetical protein